MRLSNRDPWDELIEDPRINELWHERYGAAVEGPVWVGDVPDDVLADYDRDETEDDDEDKAAVPAAARAPKRTKTRSMRVAYKNNGFGRGGFIAVEDEASDGTAAMTNIEGALIAAEVKVTSGSVAEIGAELRRLFDYAADHGWITEGQKRHRKGTITAWERTCADRRRAYVTELAERAR